MDLRTQPGATGFEFPTEITLIAFGPADGVFHAALLQALTDHGAERTAEAVSERVSSSGKFVSVRVPVRVQSRAALEALYAVINGVPGLKYRL